MARHQVFAPNNTNPASENQVRTRGRDVRKGGWQTVAAMGAGEYAEQYYCCGLCGSWKI